MRSKLVFGISKCCMFFKNVFDTFLNYYLFLSKAERTIKGLKWYAFKKEIRISKIVLYNSPVKS